MEPRDPQHYEMWPPTPPEQPGAWPGSPQQYQPAPPADPWSQQEYPAQQPDYAAGYTHPYPAPYPQPLSAPPAYPMVPTPPQRGSNTGLIVGIIAGGLVLVLVLIGIAAVALSKSGGTPVSNASGGSNPSTATSATPSRTPSATPSRATSRDLSTLDSVNTDRTPFEARQFFPEDSFTSRNDTYALTGAGLKDACADVGGSRMSAVLAAHGCASMQVGVYLNTAKTVMTSVMVVPLPDAASASAVKSAMLSDTTLGNDLSFYCTRPPDPGSQLCATRVPDLRWWYIPETFHRYFVISLTVYTDGKTPTDNTVQKNASSDCLIQTLAAIPKIR